MKKAGFIGLALVVMLVGTAVNGRAEAGRLLPVVVDPAHALQLQPWLEALRADGIEARVLAPEDYGQLREAAYGCVFAVARPEDAAFPLVQKAFTPDEISRLGTVPNRTMQIKRDLWNQGQRLLFFVASTPAALDDLRKNMRTAWWPYLCSWFDIENTSMHGY